MEQGLYMIIVTQLTHFICLNNGMKTLHFKKLSLKRKDHTLFTKIGIPSSDNMMRSITTRRSLTNGLRLDTSSQTCYKTASQMSTQTTNGSSVEKTKISLALILKRQLIQTSFKTINSSWVSITLSIESFQQRQLLQLELSSLN